MPFDSNGWYFPSRPLKKEKDFISDIQDTVRICMLTILFFGFIWSTIGYAGWLHSVLKLEKIGYPLPVLVGAMSNTSWYLYGWDWNTLYITANHTALVLYNKEYNLSKGSLYVNWGSPSYLGEKGNLSGNISIEK